MCAHAGMIVSSIVTYTTSIYYFIHMGRQLNMYVIAMKNSAAIYFLLNYEHISTFQLIYCLFC